MAQMTEKPVPRWISEATTCTHTDGFHAEQSWTVFPRHRDPACTDPLDWDGAGLEFCGAVLRIRARCERCGEPFAFLGFPVGRPNTRHAVVSADGVDLYLPVTTHDRAKIPDAETLGESEQERRHSFLHHVIEMPVKSFELERGEGATVDLDAFLKNGEPEIEDVRR